MSHKILTWLPTVLSDADVAPLACFGGVLILKVLTARAAFANRRRRKADALSVAGVKSRPPMRSSLSVMFGTSDSLEDKRTNCRSQRLFERRKRRRRHIPTTKTELFVANSPSRTERTTAEG